MESWKQTWRYGIAPQLSDAGLQSLAHALDVNDVRLIQGATTSPPPLQHLEDWPLDGACAVSFCGWQGDGLKTIGEAEEYFARVCVNCDNAMDEPAACRWFLVWFDETPRNEVIAMLLPEVRCELTRRATRRHMETQKGKMSV